MKTPNDHVSPTGRPSKWVLFPIILLLVLVVALLRYEHCTSTSTSLATKFRCLLLHFTPKMGHKITALLLCKRMLKFTRAFRANLDNILSFIFGKLY